MRFFEAVGIAIDALKANKMRSFLTMLGVIIGVGAVIGLMSVGEGAKQAIIERIEVLGTNLIFVRPGAAKEGMVMREIGTAEVLSYDDALALKESPYVKLVAPEVSLSSSVVYGGKNYRARVVGTSPEFYEIRNCEMEMGEFINENHIKGRSRVCVLGKDIAENLFGVLDPVGERVKINGRPFRIIGVLERKGGFESLLIDQAIIVPITTAFYTLSPKRLIRGGEFLIHNVNVMAVDEELIDEAEEDIREILRERHRLSENEEDDFSITSSKDLLEIASDIMGVMTILLGCIAGISLLVGGIGIMNIMLVSVAERVREIGIRKAVGAKNRDILLQFLTESVFLSFVGGGIGVLLGFLLSFLISNIRIPEHPLFYRGVYTKITPEMVLLALSISILVGLFFGIYPARRASKLDPIEALRHE